MNALFYEFMIDNYYYLLIIINNKSNSSTRDSQLIGTALPLHIPCSPIEVSVTQVIYESLGSCIPSLVDIEQ